jgi:hypothetical protein
VFERVNIRSRYLDMSVVIGRVGGELRLELRFLMGFVVGIERYSRAFLIKKTKKKM